MGANYWKHVYNKWESKKHKIYKAVFEKQQTVPKCNIYWSRKLCITWNIFTISGSDINTSCNVMVTYDLYFDVKSDKIWYLYIDD